MSKLVSDPFDVLLPQNKDAVIIILENVRKGISSGSISVKDVDKTLSQITETEEMLDIFIIQVSEYFKKYDSIKSEMNSLKPDNLDSLEAEMNKNISFKSGSELKSETFQGEIDESDSKIPVLVSSIEAKLRNFSNTTYTILTS